MDEPYEPQKANTQLDAKSPSRVAWRVFVELAVLQAIMLALIPESAWTIYHPLFAVVFAVVGPTLPIEVSTTTAAVGTGLYSWLGAWLWSKRL